MWPSADMFVKSDGSNNCELIQDLYLKLDASCGFHSKALLLYKAIFIKSGQNQVGFGNRRI